MLREEKVSETEVRLVLSGSLFGDAGEELAAKLEDLVESNYSMITLDFGMAEGISSTTIGKIISVHKRLAARERTIRIQGCSELLDRLFHKVKLDDYIQITG